MGCIVSKLFLDFYICFIFTRPLSNSALMDIRPVRVPRDVDVVNVR